jgi:predicted nuclease of restriction endonuclease-like (RecB) superfamily
MKMNKITKYKNNSQFIDAKDENVIFSNVAQIIEKRKFNAVSATNSQVVLMFWEIGTYINSVVLGMERAEYGKKILSTVSTKLVTNYGNPFERQEIANTQLTDNSNVPFNVFKDPYLLDTLGLKDNFLEVDLENAILIELEKFILEFGSGFAFMERQKRIIIDDDDFKIDLLFFHRDLRRLVAIELKTGKFKPQYKGQMELYLKWLNRYERKEGENSPVGLILCTEASRNQIELLELDKAGIAVAEYWTNLPPKNLLEQKINEILTEARERLERRKLLPNFTLNKQNNIK